MIPKLAEQGLLGIFAPEEYGGSGYDALSAAIILEEVARVDAAVALLVGSHNSLCSGHILAFGTGGADDGRFSRRWRAARSLGPGR